MLLLAALSFAQQEGAVNFEGGDPAVESPPVDGSTVQAEGAEEDPSVDSRFFFKKPYYRPSYYNYYSHQQQQYYRPNYNNYGYNSYRPQQYQVYQQPYYNQQYNTGSSYEYGGSYHQYGSYSNYGQSTGYLGWREGNKNGAEDPSSAVPSSAPPSPVDSSINNKDEVQFS